MKSQTVVKLLLSNLLYFSSWQAWWIFIWKTILLCATKPRTISSTSRRTLHYQQEGIAN